MNDFSFSTKDPQRNYDILTENLEYYINIMEKSGETKLVKFQMTIKKLLMIF